MNGRKIFTLILATLFVSSFSTLLSAGEKLSKDATQQLITGNTVEEDFVEKPWKNKIYFAADGTFRRVDQNGNPDSGKWDFDHDGSLCLERKKRKCWFLEAAGEDVYHVMSRSRGLHKKTWRLIQGNPNNL